MASAAVAKVAMKTMMPTIAAKLRPKCWCRKAGVKRWRGRDMASGGLRCEGKQTAGFQLQSRFAEMIDQMILMRR